MVWLSKPYSFKFFTDCQIHKFYLVDSLILCLKCRLSAMLFTWYNSIHGWPKLTSKMSLFRCRSIMAITNTWNAAGITFYIIQSCQMDVTQQQKWSLKSQNAFLSIGLKRKLIYGTCIPTLQKPANFSSFLIFGTLEWLLSVWFCKLSC